MIAVQSLYTPNDVQNAYRTWEANCGPAALAAVIQKPVMEAQDYFPRFPGKPWTNPTHMMAAMELGGVSYTKTNKNGAGQAFMPRYGLCFIQFDGPWSADEAKILEAYRHTHWIGYSHEPGTSPMVYDVNGGDWMTSIIWECNILSLLLKSHPKQSGTWWIRWACDVKA